MHAAGAPLKLPTERVAGGGGIVGILCWGTGGAEPMPAAMAIACCIRSALVGVARDKCSSVRKSSSWVSSIAMSDSTLSFPFATDFCTPPDANFLLAGGTVGFALSIRANDGAVEGEMKWFGIERDVRIGGAVRGTKGLSVSIVRSFSAESAVSAAAFLASMSPSGCSP
eukprot:scaffold188013_cov35-Tisochrysis_lutea.AAC.2